MRTAAEKRLLQAVVAAASLVPIAAGLMGVLDGPGWLKGVEAAPPDLESHFRYLSGIFLGVGLAFASCVPGIEAKGPRFRLLGAFVVLGGLARLLGVIETGAPSGGHLFGLGMELIVTPLLLAWQAAFARRWNGAGAAAGAES